MEERADTARHQNWADRFGRKFGFKGALMRILVTGSCGFIGSPPPSLNFVHDLDHEVAIFNALTYAANPVSLAPLEGGGRSGVSCSWRR